MIIDHHILSNIIAAHWRSSQFCCFKILVNVIYRRTGSKGSPGGGISGGAFLALKMLKGVKFIPRDKVGDEIGEQDSKKSKRKEDKHRKRSSKHRKNSSYSSSSEEDARHHRKKSSERKQKWDTGSSSSLSERKKKPKKDCSQTEEVERSGVDPKEIEIQRREMGLEWMLRPAERPARESHNEVIEEPVEEKIEIPKTNPRELNPYFTSGGSGYPEDETNNTQKESAVAPLSSVGDGGASWRLKALKRAREQAEREGKQLDEVVEERWGSLAQMTAAVVTNRAASSRAHLHAIKDRRKGHSEVGRLESENHNYQKDKDDRRERNNKREYLRDVSVRDSLMKAPKVNDSLSWRNRGRGRYPNSEESEQIKAAASSLNKFTNDGSFIEKFKVSEKKSTNEAGGTEESQPTKGDSDKAGKSFKDVASQGDIPERCEVTASSISTVQGLSANQLAAKAMQLRLKGKHEEAEKLLESQNVKMSSDIAEGKIEYRKNNLRIDSKHHALKKKQVEDDSDAVLASTILRNKLYSSHNQADDEYDYDVVSGTKERKKQHKSREQTGKKNLTTIQNRITTQQDRCRFCFDNPSRAKHLTVAIANFTYLMLPPWEPLVAGHCCILPMQHEASTRNLDDGEWEELRNFKKCLLRMFADEDKDAIFIETAMELSQQRRHCLVECIPLPRDVAHEAPLYFKKAIDEAEEEWSQHNAKKLIDTSIKGLRGSIPKNFPYFHVEFGLQKGFVHVIDDEKNFRAQFGHNVIRGMLELPEEDMYRGRRHYSLDTQHAAVSEFSKKWEPHDWTKMLD